MTIKTSDLFLSRDSKIQHRVDIRKMKHALSGWEFTITRKQHQTYVNGELESAAGIVLEVFLRKSDICYEGVIEPLGNGEYRDRSWKKVNAERRRVFDVEKLRGILDQVNAFYNSPEGRKMLLEQTIAQAELEIAELQARSDLVSEWVSGLNTELSAQLT